MQMRLKNEDTRKLMQRSRRRWSTSKTSRRMHSDFLISGQCFLHGRMARGSHGLPKVSLGPAMPYPSTPCGRTTPETALWPFQGWPTLRVGGLRPSPTLLYTPRRTPMTWDNARYAVWVVEDLQGYRPGGQRPPTG
jgi:hypothetical protein